MEPVVLKRLAAGEQDTIVASCTDYLGGPHAEAGQPCPASFLTCLSCRNARALPHQLPVQIAVRDHLATLRPNLDPPVWRTRWQSLLDLLEDIIVHYTPAEQDQARREVTPRQRRLAADLLAGTWDLR